MKKIAGLAGVLLCVCGSAQAADGRTELDFLAGQWSIHDSKGEQVGHSRIVVQAPGAMLFEERKVGDGNAQPLWLENSESTQGWKQLFVGATGQIREFRQTSQPGAWPVVMGGDVVLRDGTPARFRLTLSRDSNDSSRRLLEMSRDSGANWQTVLDYRYTRIAQQSETGQGW